MLQRDYDQLNRQRYGKKKAGDSEESGTPYHVSTQRNGNQVTTTTAVKAGSDHVYLNVIVEHSPLIRTVFQQIPGPPPPPIIYLAGSAPEIASYNTTKTTPILNKASDYKCAVIRFTIPLDQVPLLIMPIVPNQGNNTLTPFFVGISYEGVNYFFQLRYISTVNINIDGPEQNQPFQVITPFYYVYEYKVLIDMINFGLARAFAASPIPGLIGSTAVAPYIFLDPVTSLLSLITQPYFTILQDPPLTEIPIIYVNTLLQTYIDSFPFIFQQNDNPYGHDYEFSLLNVTPNQIYYPPNYALSAGSNPIQFYRWTEEFPTLQYWSSIRKILITTAGIPINAEAVPAFGNGDINVSFPIIADYVPEIEGRTGESRTIAYYLPSAQYRYVDLLYDGALQKIDLKFFWQDRLGNLYPIQISAYQQIEVKMVFVRKDINTEKSA